MESLFNGFRMTIIDLLFSQLYQHDPDEAQRHGGGQPDVHLPPGLERDRDEGRGAQTDRRHQPEHIPEAGTVDKDFGTGLAKTCWGLFMYAYLDSGLNHVDLVSTCKYLHFLSIELIIGDLTIQIRISRDHRY